MIPGYCLSLGMSDLYQTFLLAVYQVILFSSFAVNYIESLFPGHFNFKVEVMSDNWTYWVDSIKVITGVSEESDEIPTEFLLAQNYPNPFNPSTSISWQLPVGSQTTLKVYDILGREVATLVNEYKQAGKYETEFNAAILPSGVYFYQLKAGEYTSVKKMLLLK